MLSSNDLHFMVAISRRGLNGNRELFSKTETSSSSLANKKNHHRGKTEADIDLDCHHTEYDIDNDQNDD